MLTQISQVPEALLKGKISRSTLYSWVKRGKYPELFRRIGGKLFVVESRLIELLEKGE